MARGGVTCAPACGAAPDSALDGAIAQTLGAAAPAIRAFFDEATFTVSYVVHDPATRRAAIIDSVLDFDPASGRTSTASAEAICDHVEALGLHVDWILETHPHADHFSAATILQERLGGLVGIGSGVTGVERVFGRIFSSGPDIENGSSFDALFDDGSRFALGTLPVCVLHSPGHTPADVAYVIGNVLFTGDTLFMPDYGTARTDFPGGDAAQLYRSIRRLLQLPDATHLFHCHDYKAPGRDIFAWESTVKCQRRNNIHVRDGIAEADFVEMRVARDRTLSMPRLMLPSLQVNIRAGRLPPPEPNGIRYLKIPLDRF